MGCQNISVKIDAFFCKFLSIVRKPESKVNSAYNLQVEQLEQEVTELQRAVADKQEQENAMLQVSFFLHFI